jgi:phosphotransferase system enzyme I (PtsP)
LRDIRDACAAGGTSVSVCGEMAGRPLEAFALIALGYDRLSMPPTGVGPVKQMILSTDREAARRGLTGLLASGSSTVRGEIEALARKIAVDL